MTTKNIILAVTGIFLMNLLACEETKGISMPENILERKEYTIIFAGSIDNGIIKVIMDDNGIITITPSMDKISNYDPPRAAPPSLQINSDLCPLIPELFTIDYHTEEITIDGNTTIVREKGGAWSGGWWKTVVDGNETTYTNANGYWHKTIVEGNKTTETRSDGMNSITVIDGNTTTNTWSNGNEKGWSKTVVKGNTTMTTDSHGYWEKIVVEGNATTKTDSYNRWQKKIINDNNTTYDFGYWSKSSDGKKIIPSIDSRMEIVVKENVTTTTYTDNLQSKEITQIVKDENIIRVTKSQTE